MKRVLILIAFHACFLLGQTRVELSKQVKGSLPADKGGTGITSCVENEGLVWQSETFVCSPLASGPHAASHQHGGTDEVATATPGDNDIPKAGPTGTLADGWLPTVGPSKIDLTDTYPWTGTHSFTDFQDKGSQVFNVKVYGAVGDGSTDDRAAIQAAIDAAKAAGGGIVYFPNTSTDSARTKYLISSTHPSVPSAHLNITADGLILQGASRRVELVAGSFDKTLLAFRIDPEDVTVKDLTLNRVACSLDSNITATDTSISVSCPVAEPPTTFTAMFPFSKIGGQSPGAAHEIIEVTSVSGSIWTVVRAKFSTSAAAHNSGEIIAAAVAGGDGILFSSPGGGLGQFFASNLEIVLQYNGIHSTDAFPKSFWDSIIVDSNLRNGMWLKRNNEEYFANSKFMRNIAAGAKIGDSSSTGNNCVGAVYFTNIEFWNNEESGLHIEGSATDPCFGVFCTNCFSDANGNNETPTGAGVFIKNTEIVQYSGRSAFTNGAAGVHVSTGAHNITLTGDFVANNNEGVLIDGDAQKVIIGKANILNNGSAGAGNFYGIKIDGTANDIVISAANVGNDNGSNQDGGILIECASGSPDEISIQGVRYPELSSSQFTTTGTCGADIRRDDELAHGTPIYTQATLPALLNGSLGYCSDCQTGTSPCAASGNGSLAARENGQWNCK